MGSDYKIKILTTPFDGHIFNLSVGTISIGGNLDDDFYIPLLKSSDEAISILVSDDNITLQSDCNVFCNNKLLRLKSGSPLPLNILLEFKNVQFIVGNAIPEIQSTNINKHHFFDGFSIRKKTIYLSLLFSLFFIVSAFLLFILFKPIETVAPHRSFIYASLKDNNLSKVVLSWSGNYTHVTLFGRANNYNELLPLFEVLRSNNIKFTNKIITDEDIIREVYSIFHSNNIDNITIKKTNKSGVFSFQGGVNLNVDWHRIEFMLLKVYGLNEWYFIDNLSKTFEQISNELLQNGLLNKVNFHINNDAVVFTAKLDEVEKNKIELIIRKFSDSHKYLKFIYQNINYRSYLLPATSSIKISGTNGKYFLTYNNNTTITRGQLLDNQYHVLDISPSSGISLSNGQSYIHISIGSLSK